MQLSRLGKLCEHSCKNVKKIVMCSHLIPVNENVLNINKITGV